MMNRVKKLSVILLSVFAALMLCLGITFHIITNVAYAADGAATEEETSVAEVTSAEGIAYYDTLETALATAPADSTVTLLKDVTLTSTFTIDKSLTLDLNTKILNITSGYICVNNAESTVTITNGTIDQKSLGLVSAICVDAAKNVELTNVTVTSSGTYGIRFNTVSEEVTLNGCNLTVTPVETGDLFDTLFAHTTTDSQGNTVYNEYIYGVYFDNCTGNITITDCNSALGYNDQTGNDYKKSRTKYSIYLNNVSAATTISGGTFNGSYGIYDNSGCNLTVSGSEIQSSTAGVFFSVTTTGKKVIDNCTISQASYGIYIAKTKAAGAGNKAIATARAKCETIINECTIKNTNYGISDGAGYYLNYEDAIKTPDPVDENLGYVPGKTTITGCTITNFTGTAISINKTGTIDIIDTTISLPNGPTGYQYGAVNYWSRNFYMEKCSITYGKPEDLHEFNPIPVSEKKGFWAISGNGTNNDTEMYIKDTILKGNEGIYHPQYGNIVIDGGEIWADYVGMEIRAGNLTMKNNATIIIDPNAVYNGAHHASSGGSVESGAALVIAQHTTDQPMDIKLESATLSASSETDSSGNYKQMAMVQVDPEAIEDRTPIKISISDGKYSGGIFVNEERLTPEGIVGDPDDHLIHFITGGEFSNPPKALYVAENYTEIQESNGKYLVVPDDVEQAKRDACAFLRLYAAAKRVEYTAEMDAKIHNDTIVTTIGVYNAKIAVMDDIDNAYNTLVAEREAAIEAINTEAAEHQDATTGEKYAAVVVPTATLAAINEAIDSAQIIQFRDNAIAEIKDIRAYRKQINDLIDTKGAEVLNAIKALRETLLGDGTEANVGKLAQMQTALEAKIAAVQDKVDTLATSDELSTVKTDLAAAIGTAAETLTGVINEVKTVADNNANALADLGVDVTAVKTAVDAIDTVNVAALQEKLTALQTAISTAVSEAETRLNQKLETLTTNLGTLTGRLNEVNSGLVTEMDTLEEKISKLGTFSDSSLEEELGEIDMKLNAIASKVSAAVNVESEKTRASEKIKSILNGLLSTETANTVGAKAVAARSPADSGLTAAEREKLREVYSDKIAALIELYYNEANADVANATTAEEAHSAADNFKRNVDTAKLIDSLGSKEDASLKNVYLLLIVAVAISALALILTIALLARKKQTANDYPDDPDSRSGNNGISEDRADYVEFTENTEPENGEATATEENEVIDETVEFENEEAIEDGDFDDEDDGRSYHTGHFKSFKTRLQEASDRTLELYSAIKNEFCGYRKVKSRMCKTCESFHEGNRVIAKLKVTSQTVRLYLALDPTLYEAEKYHHTDKSDVKAYAGVPMMIKISGSRSLKHAEALILDLLEDDTKIENYVCIDYAEKVRQQAAAEADTQNNQ